MRPREARRVRDRLRMGKGQVGPNRTGQDGMGSSTTIAHLFKGHKDFAFFHLYTVVFKVANKLKSFKVAK